VVTDVAMARFAAIALLAFGAAVATLVMSPEKLTEPGTAAAPAE
jgi:hypothetical protein